MPQFLSYIFFNEVSAVAVCPVCNSLTTVIKICPNCGRQMADAGKIQDYLDDYSPYLAQDIYQDSGFDGSDQCVHLFACPHCHYDKRFAFHKQKGQKLID